MAQEGTVGHRAPGLLLRRLAQLGIVTFLVISAFDIHRWRREPWQDFELGFAALAGHIFGQPPQPGWLYLVAAPFVAINFVCMVLLVLGRRRGILAPFVASALMIAVMPLFAGQMVVSRMIWEQILTAFGYAVAGAIAVTLALGLDTPHSAAKQPAQSEED